MAEKHIKSRTEMEKPMKGIERSKEIRYKT